jgi:heptose-I-phosphate ethanolaminephosphotransferase
LKFWFHWAGAVSALRTQWGQLDHSRRQLTEQARLLSPVASPSSPDTLVLVISESINRQHLEHLRLSAPNQPQAGTKNSRPILSA